MMSKPEPVSLFISYAHKDEPLRKQLETHLSLLQRQGLISTWQDRRIMAGTDWAQAIDEHLNSASIILLLISANFLASDYCSGVEMQRALDRDKAGQARVIPIIVRPCDKKGAPFAHLQALPKDARAITAWNNRDEAWTDVIAGIRRVIEALPPLAVRTSPAALPHSWHVPYPHNPLFTGREELLTQLVTTLHTGQPTALSQPQAISCLGGIVKTQLALEYTYRYRGDYQAVLWAQAETRENLTSSYLTIATLLNLPEKNEQESVRIIAAVKNWLQRHTNWLLILDNADDLALARDFLPPSVGGHVLLTTRAQATGRFAHPLEVGILPTEQGALFLLRRAGLLPADAPLEQASDHDRDQARAICEELGGLPLALDQAGAYIEETGCSLSEYQRLFQRHRVDLLAKHHGLIEDHPKSVATTWSLSFERVEQNNPAAADLLRLCAFLAPDAILEEIITKGAEHLGPQLAPVGADAYLLNQSIEALHAYSLLRRETSSETVPLLSMHRLVQAVILDQMDSQSRRQWTKRAVQAINAAFPKSGTFDHWNACAHYVPHVLIVSSHLKTEGMVLSEAAAVLRRTGWYLGERGQHREAEELLQHALMLQEQNEDGDELALARAALALAWLYNQEAKYMKAEPLFQRALSIIEQQLGPEHRETADCLNNLALLYDNQGKYAQAEPLYQRALAIREQQVGPQHLDTAQSLNNLAGLYDNQSKYAQAEPLYQRALAIREQQVGPQHPDTATSLNNLAALYRAQGQYEQAEPLFQRALSIDEHTLGPQHPTTQVTRANHADLLRTMGHD